ncbi:TetR family transcriptional regulator [Streptomyces cinnabarinus]|uniref:TetR family transcriptional regulator n=1 Tax=Streptomyces cinnabarinus TaxID=67287 RepID=A0ABY7KQU5_9ACTN|nr:TetR/AcrR family transcriptional regulator [Streptomyces cinnabarinus]WAZ25076.1 TetR family transcriptional regulator [Streptomyces cinnabarinus]
MKSRRTDGSVSPSEGPELSDAPATYRGRSKRARSGRRPGDSGTREQILESALHLFAERGYARTTIRAIAESAQVDPALVHHFFTNKEGVFDAAINSPFSVSAVVGEAPLADTTTTQAEWLAMTYFSFWENEKTRYAMKAIYRAGLADGATAEVLKHRIETSAKAWANASGYKEQPDAEVRVALASGHLAGLAILRYVLEVQPLAGMEFAEFMAWVKPSLELRLSAELKPRQPAEPGADED